MIYNDLALFTLVAKHLSFSAAAQQLGIPLSRASRRIAGLEAYYGTKLFERSTRSVRLTEEGQRLLSLCQGPMEALHEATGFTEDTRNQVIHITAPVVAARTTVGPKVLDYAAAHPELSIHLTSTNALLDFYRDRIDFAFRVGPLDDSNLIARKLWSIDYAICASKRFVEQHGLQQPQPIAQVLQLPAIVSHQHWLLVGGSRVQPANIVHRIDDLDVIREAVRRDMGIAMLPSDMIEEDMQTIALSDADVLSREMYAVYPGKRLLPTRVRNLIDYMAGTPSADTN